MSGSELVDPLGDKRMKLRYAGTCRTCERELPARAVAIYERATKTVRCVECPRQAPAQAGVVSSPMTVEVPEPDEGGAGASARREYERRRANDEARIRAEWGRLGGLAVRLAGERQTTTAWARGAVGEERLGARLDGLVGDTIAVLHDRRIPRTKANIDHLVVTTGGVWVVDAKRYQGRPDLRVEGGILLPRVEKLMVGRRDCTKLVDGVLKQMGLVREVLGEVPVTGALCFVEADWPLIGGAFTTREVQVLWPKLLARRLAESEGSVDVLAVRDVLASHFSPA